MSYAVVEWPRARKAHACSMCGRSIGPGETYQRASCFEGGTAWTQKTCGHCCRCEHAFARAHDWPDNFDPLWVAEWMEEEHPAWYAQLIARWRDETGELLPYPFEVTCSACGVEIGPAELWCGPCDTARREQIVQELQGLQRALKETSRG